MEPEFVGQFTLRPYICLPSRHPMVRGKFQLLQTYNFQRCILKPLRWELLRVQKAVSLPKNLLYQWLLRCYCRFPHAKAIKANPWNGTPVDKYPKQAVDFILIRFVVFQRRYFGRSGNIYGTNSPSRSARLSQQPGLELPTALCTFPSGAITSHFSSLKTL